MNDSEFFQYVMDVYRTERAEIDRLYTRLSFAVTLNVALFGAFLFLFEPAYIDAVLLPEYTDWHIAMQAGLFYLAFLTGIGCLFTSSCYLAVCLVARRYDRDALPDKWADWAKEHKDYLRECHTREHGTPPADWRIEYDLANERRTQIQSQLFDTTKQTRDVNKRRGRQFVTGIKWTVVALIPLSMQAFMCAILWLQFR